ncbi:MAG: M81 family metallopeptidase [Alphaproteobacteria bacterium]|nr:M81 family metallopeptidase [Alphaproteobacteria bacterium]
MRIAIGGFQHETNCFQPSSTGFEDFLTAGGWPGLTIGAAVPEAVKGHNLAIAGFIAQALADGHEISPLAWANAQPAGRVTDDAFDRISAIFVEQLASLPALDMVYFDLHGAMVTESYDDADSEFLLRMQATLAARFGEGVPIIASHDWHGNLSPLRISLLALLDSYQTYPHIDMRATGERLAREMRRLTPRTMPPHRRLIKSDYLIPLTAQSSLSSPMAELLRLRDRIATRTGVVLGLVPGFPPSDVPMVGPAVYGYGHDPQAVDLAVTELAAALAAAEPDFAREEILSLPAARNAIANQFRNRSGKPLILADSQDNPGAGGSSDTVGILAEAIAHCQSLSPQERQPIAMALFYAPEIAKAAQHLGRGGSIKARLNGLPLVARIAELHEGDLVATGPMWGESVMNLGVMARLDLLAEDGSELNIRLLLASRRQQPSTQAIFRILGVEPAAMAVLVLKSSVHFRADFQALAEKIQVVAAPGVNLANPADFAYRRIRPGLRLFPAAACP